MALRWMSYALPGLAQTSLDLNPVGNPWNQAKNLQHHKKATSKVGLKKDGAKGLEQHHSKVPPNSLQVNTTLCAGGDGCQRQ